MDDPNSPAQQLAQLRMENEALRVSLRQSTQEGESLREESQLLHAERIELLSELKQRDHKIDDLQHQVQSLLRRYFGRSSEKLDP